MEFTRSYKRIGLIGGMGSAATVRTYRSVAGSLRVARHTVCGILGRRKCLGHEQGFVQAFPIPANVDPAPTEVLQRTAVKVHREIGAAGYSRVDMLLTPDSNINVLEINTLPGLLPQSVFPQALKCSGMPYEEMVDKMILSALKPKRHCVVKQFGQLPTLSASALAAMSNAA